MPRDYTQFGRRKLTEQIMALGNNDIEKELLVSCTMLDPQQQEVVLNMVKLYLVVSIFII